MADMLSLESKFKLWGDDKTARDLHSANILVRDLALILRCLSSEDLSQVGDMPEPKAEGGTFSPFLTLR